MSYMSWSVIATLRRQNDDTNGDSSSTTCHVELIIMIVNSHDRWNSAICHLGRGATPLSFNELQRQNDSKGISAR